MSDVKGNVANAGFSKLELLGFKHQLWELKKTYHPNLTEQLSLHTLIIEEARKSLISTRYYIVAIVVFSIAALMFGEWDYIYMPVGMIFLALLDIRSSAKEANRTIKSQLKLMRLAVTLWF
ncbi:hypothetical protein ACQ3G7_00385 [Kosakonia oryzendophytica]|uniref:hypothetical protein n=1 Tax=Kosakonia oryzendophytica TaxID=1005665 RepID=UPI003D347E2C